MSTTSGRAEQPTCAAGELAEALSLLRIRMNCSVRGLAKAVHRDAGTVSRYLNGRRLPPEEFVEALLQLAAVRGVAVGAAEKERISGLLRRALETNAGRSARERLLRQDLAAATARARAGELALLARALLSARGSGPYWSAFIESLEIRRVPCSFRAAVDDVTGRVMACIADPTNKAARPTSGVVTVGLQEGKTLYGLGVVARALDAGYQTVIVFSGVLNLLRAQTQTRLEEFLPPVRQGNHGPNLVGQLRLLTTPDLDYHQAAATGRRLEAQVDDPRSGWAQLAVCKQNSVVLRRILTDLDRAAPALRDAPTLIVNLEPGRATQITGPGPTDLQRARLIEKLPRAQYLRFEDPAFGNWHTPQPDFVLRAQRPAL